jgi:hypothetical protein
MTLLTTVDKNLYVIVLSVLSIVIINNVIISIVVGSNKNNLVVVKNHLLRLKAMSDL